MPLSVITRDRLHGQHKTNRHLRQILPQKCQKITDEFCACCKTPACTRSACAALCEDNAVFLVSEPCREYQWQTVPVEFKTSPSPAKLRLRPFLPAKPMAARVREITVVSAPLCGLWLKDCYAAYQHVCPKTGVEYTCSGQKRLIAGNQKIGFR